MKIVNKKIKFRGHEGQRFYHEEFENYKEFFDTVKKREKENPHKTLQNVLNSGGTSWVGVNSVEEAEKMLLNGWQKHVENLKMRFNKELALLERTKPNKLINSVAGFMPIVPNALLGLPNSMIDQSITRRKTKVLNFMISISRACSNSADEIIEKMSKQLAYIAALERSGIYRCRIEVFFPAFGGRYREGKTNTSISVLVKSEDQLFDIKRLCFPIIHPAMLRLFAFAWEETLPLKYDDYIDGGYGTAFEHWSSDAKKEYIDLLNTNGCKTICIDLFSDVGEILRKEVN